MRGSWRPDRALTRRLNRLFGAENRDHGALAILAAFFLTVLVFAAALSLDITGRVAEARRDQAAADLAALDAARGVSLVTSQASIASAAQASALRNNINATVSGYAVTATAGTVVAGVFTPCVLSTCPSPNAVKVSVTTPYNDWIGRSHSELTRSAVAQLVSQTVTSCTPPSCTSTVQTASTAQFSIGSTLAEVQVGLGALSTNISAVGYQGLVSGQVTLGQLATQLGFSALSADQVLASNVTAATLMSAAAALLGTSNPAYVNLSNVAGVMAANATFGGSSNKINIGQALGLQQGNGVGLATNVNLLQLVDGGIQLANQQAGISANLSVTGLSPLADASFSVTAIVPPTISEPPNGLIGTTATNTQVTVLLTVDMNVSVTGILGLVAVHLPLTLTLGGATGTLTGIDCDDGVVKDLKLGSTFNDVNATVGAGTFSAVLGTIAGTIGGGATITSNPVSTATVSNSANFVTGSDTPVSVNSSLNAATTNVTSTLTLGSLSLSLLNAAVDTALNSTLTPLVSAIGSTLATLPVGVNVGNADYLGIQAACSVSGYANGLNSSGGSTTVISQPQLVQ